MNSFTSIIDLTVLHESVDYSVVQFELKTGDKYVFAFSLTNKDEGSGHTIQLAGKELKWKGVYDLVKLTTIKYD